jgi:ATP-dependent DNA helicase RecG
VNDVTRARTKPAAAGKPRAELAPDAAPELVALTALPGIGPARAERLARLGLASLRDLLLTVPRNVAPWPAPVAIRGALASFGEATEPLTIAGTVVRWSFQRFGRRSLLRVRVADATGELDVLFFNQPWLRERLAKGEALEVHGRMVDAKGPALAASRLGSANSALPAPGSLIATYPSTDGLAQEFLRGLCVRAAAEHAHRLREHLSEAELARLAMPRLPDAVSALHAPRSLEEFVAARRRVAFETMLRLQAQVAARRLAREGGHALAVRVDAETRASLFARLPFELTAGQRGVIGELERDLARAVPMRRLLQGDVGSGKTVLGIFACMLVGARGGQSAFLAPTELLVEQHFDGLRELLKRAQLRAAMLTGSMSARERKAVLTGLASGAIDVVFGTHALLEPGVVFRGLALAVIDEQQRFGVAQRERLIDKGRDVHGLLMTATPIPRSLALTVYGDLDLSLLRERPPGRGAIETIWWRKRPKVELLALLEARLQRGEQLYWVVPRIEGDDDAAPGAEARFAKISASSLAAHGVELVHGRLPAAERAARLERFRRGAARVLVATTVIEVGVDVPRATMVVIESAERLGLAQLHQLRGRVGRGSEPSVCVLLGAASAGERFEMLEQSADGFEISEADLRQRGMGDLVGLRQAGFTDFEFDATRGDLELLLQARDCIAARPELGRLYEFKPVPA